jgi:hypothetical protein
MRMTAKNVAINSVVKNRFIFRPHQCNLCKDLVFFEFVFKVKEQAGVYCKRCVSNKEDVYNLTITYNLTAADIIQNNENRKLIKEISVYKTYKDAIESITKEVMALPDGEVSPSVYSVIVKYIT